MTSVGDLALCTFESLVAGQAVQNTFGFKAIDGTATLAGLETAIVAQLNKNTSGGLAYTRHTSTTIETLRTEDVYPGTGESRDWDCGQTAGTNNTADLLPPQCAVVVKLTTGLAGRSYRGRLYLAGYTEADQAAGVWTAGCQTNVISIPAGMLTRFGPSGTDGKWQWVVISRFHNNSVRNPPIGTPITSYVVRSTVYNQRRRTIGVGR